MKPIFFCFALVLIISSKAQETINVNLYATTKNYLDASPSYENINAEAFRVEDEYVAVKKFIDPETGKKFQDAHRNPAVLQYGGHNYFNLNYSTDLPRKNLFVKLDQEGERLGVLLLNREKIDVLSGTNPAAYGGGLLGVLLKESEKWGGNWVDQKNEKARILIFDFRELFPSNSYHKNEDCSKGVYMTRKDLIEIMGWDKKPKDIKYLSFEDAVAYLERFNSRG